MFFKYDPKGVIRKMEKLKTSWNIYAASSMWTCPIVCSNVKPLLASQLLLRALMGTFNVLITVGWGFEGSFRASCGKLTNWKVTQSEKGTLLPLFRRKKICGFSKQVADTIEPALSSPLWLWSFFCCKTRATFTFNFNYFFSYFYRKVPFKVPVQLHRSLPFLSHHLFHRFISIS